MATTKNKKNSVKQEKVLENLQKDTHELLVALEKAHKLKQKLFRDMQTVLDKKHVQKLNEIVQKMGRKK